MILKLKVKNCKKNLKKHAPSGKNFTYEKTLRGETTRQCCTLYSLAVEGRLVPAEVDVGAGGHDERVLLLVGVAVYTGHRE